MIGWREWEVEGGAGGRGVGGGGERDSMGRHFEILWYFAGTLAVLPNLVGGGLAFNPLLTLHHLHV